MTKKKVEDEVPEEPTLEEAEAEPDFDEFPAEGRLPEEAPPQTPDHNAGTLRPYV